MGFSKAYSIIYAIKKEVSRFSFTEWLECNDITEDEWKRIESAIKREFYEVEPLESEEE